jgi:hypothetical protein
MIVVGVVLSIIAGQANYRAVYGSIQNNFINQFEDKNMGMKFTYPFNWTVIGKSDMTDVGW